MSPLAPVLVDTAADLAWLGPPQQGKVRDLYPLGDDELAIVVTDRLSAFDVILGAVPHKGQVLNQLSAWWFDQLADVVPSHLVAVPDPNVSVVRRCRPLPVEVIVRGFITGVTSTSLWRLYEQGERSVYGVTLPEGLAKNDPLPTALVTPTTKAAAGQHDEKLTPAEVVERGLAPPALWAQTHGAALEVFARGQALAAAAGLVLVDTKYEFGLDEEGRLTLIDEVHTPDSSRYWLAETLEARRAEGREPDSADKELIRLAYAERGYRGEGPAPPLPDELAELASRRYIEVAERLTGAAFEPAASPAGPRISANVRAWLDRRRP